MKITKSVLFLLFSFLITDYYFGQSLPEILNRMKTENDRQKVESYLDISELPLQKDSTLFYISKGLDYCASIGYDTIYPFYFARSITYYYNGEYDLAKKSIREGEQFVEKTLVPNAFLGQIRMLLGVYSEGKNQVDSAKYFYDSSLEILKNDFTKKSYSLKNSVYANYANIYIKNGDYKKAIEIYLKSLKGSQDLNEFENQIIVYNNIGSCYLALDEFENSLDYYNKGLKICEEQNEKQFRCGIRLDVGQILIKQEELSKALSYLRETELLIDSSNFNRLYSILYLNYSKIFLKNNQIDSANYYSNLAINRLKEHKDDFTEVPVLLIASDVSLAQNLPQESKFYLDKAIQLSEENNYSNLQLEATGKLIEWYKKYGKENELLALYPKFMALVDSVRGVEKIKAIKSIEFEYNLEKEEKKNLELELELQKEKALSENKSWWLYFILISIILNILIIVAWIQRKRLLKNKQEKHFETFLSEKYNLTNLEVETWRYISEGCSEKEVAHYIIKSIDSVKGYRRELYKKIKKKKNITYTFKQKNAILLFKEEKDSFS